MFLLCLTSFKMRTNCWSISIILSPDLDFFTWVSKRNWFYYATRLAYETRAIFSSNHQIVNRSQTFSHASRWLYVFTSCFDWFTVFSVFFVIGYCNYFGFTRHSVEKRSVTTLIWWLLHKLQDLFYHWTTIGDILLSVAKMTREKINFWPF